MKLSIESLEVSDLQDTGSFLDPQDPSVQIVIGKHHLTTERYIRNVHTLTL